MCLLAHVSQELSIWRHPTSHRGKLQGEVPSAANPNPLSESAPYSAAGRAAGRETLHHLGRVREFQKGFDMGMRKLLLEPFNQESRNINFSLANNPGFPGDT